MCVTLQEVSSGLLTLIVIIYLIVFICYHSLEVDDL